MLISLILETGNEPCNGEVTITAAEALVLLIAVLLCANNDSHRFVALHLISFASYCIFIRVGCNEVV